MYHYKAPHDGCTRHSVNGLKFIDKIGKLISIEAYTVGAIMQGVNTKWVDKKIRIRVTGEKGTCTYGGFLWGYGGEGPHGLVDLFIKCGMETINAENYALIGNALGPNVANDKNTKLYNKTTLWKFLNSDLGWNLIDIEKQVPKFKKGQKLWCNYNGDKIPFKCTFVRYIDKIDFAIVKASCLNEIGLQGNCIVHINSLKTINQSNKFKKGQKLWCNYSGDKIPYKCTFVKYKSNSDQAYVTCDIPLINIYGVQDSVPVNSLTPA